MTRDFSAKIVWAGTRIFRLFEITESHGGRFKTRKQVWEKLPHYDWIPAELKQYALEINGYMLAWKSREDGSGRPACRGRYELLPLEHIYADWKDHVYFGFPEEDPRLACFKVVDLFAPEASVGLYHDAAQDPGLYYHQHGEGTVPYPLYLDLLGYLRLLEQSLGYHHWQLSLLALLPNDGRNPAYQTDPAFLGAFRRDLEAWDPEFDYDAFVALYHEVKLKDYTPSGL